MDIKVQFILEARGIVEVFVEMVSYSKTFFAWLLIFSAVHKAITCDYNTVKAQCGVNAAEWVEQFEELINSKYMDEVHGCSGKAL